LIMVRYGRPGLVGRGIKGVFANNLFKIKFNDEVVINMDFAYIILNSFRVQSFIKNNLQVAGLPAINHSITKRIQIPLPPLSVQEEIVAEIDGYQKIIDGARQVVENYKPTIKIDPDWEMVKLGDIATTEYGHSESAKESGNTRFVRITDIDENGKLIEDDFKYIDLNEESQPYILKKGNIVVARTGATYGKTLLFNADYQSVFAGYLIRLNFDNDKLLNEYYWVFAQSDNYIKQKESLVQGGGQPQFNANAIKKLQIPLPPLSVQQEIVAQIEAEQEMVAGNKKLIEIYEQKIKDKIGEVWGEE